MTDRIEPLAGTDGPAGTAESLAEILIVDDSTEHADAVALALRGSSYGVRVTATGCEAIAAIASRMPDLIVLDVGLPDIDGFDVCRLVRRLDPTGLIPVIFVSAFESTTAKLTAFAAGAIDYLVKPCGTEELLARVDAHLLASRRRRDAEDVRRELETAARILGAYSFLDPLTGVGNRRHFEETLAVEWRRALRGGSAIGLVMVEIDYFDGVSKACGQQVGDECVRRVAEALRNALRRPGDTVARFSGELFAAVLPGTNLTGAAEVAEALRRAVERLAIVNLLSPYGILTVSVGVAASAPATGDHPGLLVTATDAALRIAKDEGRNRVCRRHSPR